MMLSGESKHFHADPLLIYLSWLISRTRSISFYPTSASVTIFLHVLAEPSRPQAESDVELLRSARGLLNSVPIRKPTPLEISHIQFLNGFIKELIRLGTCAISKAKRELELGVGAPM